MSTVIQNITFPKARMDRMQGFARGTIKMDAASEPRWKFQNLDASDTQYIAQQLEEIRQGLYEIQYGKLKAQRLVPWNTSISPGKTDYTVRAIDVTGTPVPMMGRERNLPTVRHTIKQGTIKFWSFGLGYDYTVQEARESREAGMPLEARLAATCHERQMRNLDSLALIGDASKVTDIGGLFTSAGTLTVAAPTDGAGGLSTIESKSPDLVIRDLNAPINKIITTTFEIESPDTLVLPVTTETYISQVRVGDGTSSTIMQFFKANRPEITVERSMYLEASAGNWTGKRMIAYQNDPNRLEMLVSIMFDQAPPQYDGYVVSTMTETRTAGIALYLPQSVCMQDQV